MVRVAVAFPVSLGESPWLGWHAAYRLQSSSRHGLGWQRVTRFQRGDRHYFNLSNSPFNFLSVTRTATVSVPFTSLASSAHNWALN